MRAGSRRGIEALSTPGRLVAMAVPVLLIGVLTLGGGEGEGADSARSVRAGLGELRPQRPVRTLALAPGESLGELLRRGGLSAREARRFLDLVRPHADWTEPHPGTTGRFHAWSGERPERVELAIDGDRTLDYTLSGAVWSVRVDSVAVRVDTVVVTGRVESTLWSAELGGDADRLDVAEKSALVDHLGAVYAWQIDFFRDPRPGDAFALALARSVRPDGSTRDSRVLAAEYVTSVERLAAVRFAPSDGSGALFFDDEGQAVRGAFLKAPLDLVRVTSRFGPDRFHPVLGAYRSHTGVDYGAASGSVVRATGDGIVRTAAWSGDYGLMIEIDHGRGIRTRYAHLSGVADGVRPGARIVQGDAIGAVGSTGLSTAPHLHYEFLLNGRPVDPSSVDLPVERPVPDADRDRFVVERDAALGLLGRASSWVRSRGPLETLGPVEPRCPVETRCPVDTRVPDEPPPVISDPGGS